MGHSHAWFIALCAALGYHFIVWESIGRLKSSRHLTHPMWFYIRLSGLVAIVVALIGCVISQVIWS
jgi:hypothetical protein